MADIKHFVAHESLDKMTAIIAISSVVLFFLWETFLPFYLFFKGNLLLRVRHFVHNVSITFLNSALGFLIFMPLWNLAANGSMSMNYGLYALGLPTWLHVVFSILLLDLWTYWWHRANHTIPFLWRFHRMHHSDPWMDISTARRFHPVEIILSSLLRLPLIFILGISLWDLLVYSVLMGIIVDFQHANIVLPEKVDKWLRFLIATPSMHKVHHSQIPIETDSNYTSLLSVWDRIFGSFRLRSDLADIEIGLKKWSNAEHQTISGMLLTPWTQSK